MSKRMKTTSFEAYLAEQMQDPEFKREYDALETEFSIRRQLIDLRLARGWSQTELAAKVGTPRPSISRVEARGVKDLDFARRLAEALDCRLEVRFVPKTGTLPKETKAAQARGAARKRKVKV
jgi:ribosome-binding protein aMBF1 (putative translation factor)